MRSSLQQSAKSAERGSEAFPWQNKTLIKTQSTVCSMQRASSSEPALIGLISAVQGAATVSENIALAGKNCPHSSLLQYRMSSTQSFHCLGETQCVPGTIKQQRLLKATECNKKQSSLGYFHTLYIESYILHQRKSTSKQRQGVYSCQGQKRLGQIVLANTETRWQSALLLKQYSSLKLRRTKSMDTANVPLILNIAVSTGELNMAKY